MKKIHFTILGLIALVILSCQTFTGSQSPPEAKQEKLQGELMFKLISFGSLYGAPEPVIQAYEQMVDSLSKEKNLPENYRMFLADHHLLKEYGLLYKPYFHLKADSAKVIAVFVSEEEYLKIKEFELNQLQQENKKVEVKMEGTTINEGIFKCSSIIVTKKVEGETYWKK